MKNLKIVFVLIALLQFSPSNAQSRKEKKRLANFKELIEHIKAKDNFSFTANWTGTTNLIDNPNYLNFQWSEVDLSLPFLGDVVGINGYNRDDVTIIYKGEPEDLKINFDTVNYRASLEFKGTVNGKTRVYRLIMMDKNKAELTIENPDRDNITYRGEYRYL